MKFFKCGINVFNKEQKVNLLKIDAEAEKTNCVSSAIAITIAMSVAKFYKKDWSIAVTGNASTAEESHKRLFDNFSISYNGKLILSERSDLNSKTKHVNVHLYYTEFILGCFKLELNKSKAEQN